MASRSFNLRRFLAACLVIVAESGGLFALALLGAALTGKGFIGSVLLLGFGTILLALSVVTLVFGIKYWK